MTQPQNKYWNEKEEEKIVVLLINKQKYVNHMKKFVSKS